MARLDGNVFSIFLKTEGEFYENQSSCIGNRLERLRGSALVGPREESRCESLCSARKKAYPKRVGIKEAHWRTKGALAYEKGQDRKSYRSVESWAICRSQRARCYFQ